MKRKIIVSLAAVIAVILLLTQFLIPMVTAAEGATDLPFKATIAGTARWEFPGTTPANCTEVTTLTEATGQGTHMGRVEAFFYHCPDEPDNLNDGKMTLIAANGDELYGMYNYDPLSERNDFPVTIIGGTGSFVDASGVVVLTYEVVPQFVPECDPESNSFGCMDFSIPWPWSATLAGTVSY